MNLDFENMKQHTAIQIFNCHSKEKLIKTLEDQLEWWKANL